LLSIPVLKGLMKSLDHKRGTPDAVATANPAAEEAPECSGGAQLAALAAYLELDVLAVIVVPPGSKSAEITAAGRAGLTTNLAMPLVEDRGMLAKLIAAHRPKGGRGKVFVTSQIFPRDGNWCDFLPLDSSLAYFFVPAGTLAAVANLPGIRDDMFVLAADLSQDEPDYVLELKTYLAAGLFLLSSGSGECAGRHSAAKPLEHFLKKQGYSMCLADTNGDPVDWEGRPSIQPDPRLAAAGRLAAAVFRHPGAGFAGGRQIALGEPHNTKAHAYPVMLQDRRAGYLVLSGGRPDEQKPDLRREWLNLLGRFTSSIAHEIKNPLTGIAAGVQYLSKRLQPGVAEADTVDFILAEISRLNRIVDDLYKIARPPQLVLKSACINDVLAKSLFCISEEMVKKRLRLVQHVDPQMPAFRCDPERLQQVLINVIKNAIEASPEGGEVEVATASEGGRLTVRVKDHGQGVPEADAGKIFEPFFSTKKGGTGLGLCISQAIINEHGGKMWLETPPEGGAVFVIDLPLEREHGKNTDS
jgi:signal transduction histidine kinase